MLLSGFAYLFEDLHKLLQGTMPIPTKKSLPVYIGAWDSPEKTKAALARKNWVQGKLRPEHGGRSFFDLINKKTLPLDYLPTYLTGKFWVSGIHGKSGFPLMNIHT
jgi:hypothetical protein